jgi:hypothetical protein
MEGFQMSEFRNPSRGQVRLIHSGIPPLERRPKRRKRVLYPGLIVHANGSTDCTIRNLTEYGAHITVRENEVLPSNFYLISIPDRLAYDAEVIWKIGVDTGVTYEKIHDLSNAVDPSLYFLKRLWLARASQ